MRMRRNHAAVTGALMSLLGLCAAECEHTYCAQWARTDPSYACSAKQCINCGAEIGCARPALPPDLPPQPPLPLPPPRALAPLPCKQWCNQATCHLQGCLGCGLERGCARPPPLPPLPPPNWPPPSPPPTQPHPCQPPWVPPQPPVLPPPSQPPLPALPPSPPFAPPPPPPTPPPPSRAIAPAPASPWLPAWCRPATIATRAANRGHHVHPYTARSACAIFHPVAHAHA